MSKSYFITKSFKQSVIAWNKQFVAPRGCWGYHSRGLSLISRFDNNNRQLAAKIRRAVKKIIEEARTVN